MRRATLFAASGCALAGLTATAVSQTPVPVDPAVPQQVTVRVGDSVVVDGVPIGCAVTKRSGRVVIECGRTGSKIAGSYMSIVSSRTLKVARLRSAGVAKTILTATQFGGWRACGTGTRAVQSGGATCK